MNIDEQGHGEKYLDNLCVIVSLGQWLAPQILGYSWSGGSPPHTRIWGRNVPLFGPTATSGRTLRRMYQHPKIGLGM